MTTSVYWIRCADHTDMTSQGYIGVSGRFDRRMWEHNNLEGNRHLKFAIKKYGWDLMTSQALIHTCLQNYLALMEQISLPVARQKYASGSAQWVMCMRRGLSTEQSESKVVQYAQVNKFWWVLMTLPQPFLK